MIIAAILITIITILVAILNRSWKWQVCPICAGVSATWLLMTIAVLAGWLSSDYKLPIAMLMGATVVGVAFQGSPSTTLDNPKVVLGKEKFERRSNLWFWKAPVIILGMLLAYWLFRNMSWWAVVIEVAILIVLLRAFFFKDWTAPKIKSPNRDSLQVGQIKKQMEKCC